MDQRLSASVAAAVVGWTNGAQIIRAHDVKETVEALRVALGIRTATGQTIQ